MSQPRTTIWRVSAVIWIAFFSCGTSASHQAGLRRAVVAAIGPAKHEGNAKSATPVSRQPAKGIPSLTTKRGGGEVGSAADGKLNSIDMMIAGGIATALGDLAMHPIDTIKTVQQAMPAGISIMGACRKILKDAGPMGFYAGVVPYVTMDGISGAIKFASYEAGKRFVEPLLPPSLLGYSHFVCAAGAFLTCSVVLVPGELLKQRLQAGVARDLMSGAGQIWRKQGLPGFFTGYKATLMRDVPYTMLELGLYENFKTALRRFKRREELTTWEELGAAALTGGIVGYVTNPLDLVKTRLMTGTGYAGFADVVSKMYRFEGGFKSFLSGSNARVMWLLPFTVIHLGVYEGAKRLLARMKS